MNNPNAIAFRMVGNRATIAIPTTASRRFSLFTDHLVGLPVLFLAMLEESPRPWFDDTQSLLCRLLCQGHPADQLLLLLDRSILVAVLDEFQIELDGGHSPPPGLMQQTMVQ